MPVANASLKSRIAQMGLCALLAISAVAQSCSRPNARGIADRRSDFRAFLPMHSNPASEGLKPVKPFFHRANRSQIFAAIERACQDHRTGSSVYDPKTQTGYYVNCNPRNRQLLNGYVPVNPAEPPHSR